MSSALIIAWYGCLLLAGQWGLIGPYESREACMSVVEWLETQGFDTETCTVVDTGVEALLIQVGEVPHL